MTDTVQTNVISDGSVRKVVQFLNTSDGTGESTVVKLDASADTDATTYSIQEVEWSIQGFTALHVHFDAATDDEALYLGGGNGYRTFADAGGLRDPRSTTYTGDVTFTTVGGAAGSTYDVTLHVKKHL